MPVQAKQTAPRMVSHGLTGTKLLNPGFDWKTPEIALV